MLESKDAVHTTVTVHLSLWDRFKVALGARVYVRVVVETEFVVGVTRTQSTAWASPWAFWRRWTQHRGGYAEAREKEATP